MKLSLNFGNVEKKRQEKLDRIEVAEKKVKKAKEVLPMNEAWKQIFSRKNSNADEMKLKEVYYAMQANKIGREQGAEEKTFTKAEALRQWHVLNEITRVEKLDRLVEEIPDNYILVQDESQFDEMVQVMIQEKEIGVDTETTGVDVYRDKIVGISLTAPKGDKHYYIPIRHETNEKQLKPKYVMKRLTSLFMLENIVKVFHNANFDLHMFLGEDIRFGGKVHCTQIRMHLLNENENSFRLKDLVTKYLKIPSDTFDVLFGKNCLFSTVPLKYARYYACKDTDVTMKLYYFQEKHFETKELEPVKKNYAKIEQPLIYVVVDMERVGFELDLEEVENQRHELNGRKEHLEGWLRFHFGDINFNSVKQLSDVIYGKKKLHQHFPKGAKKSTDTKTMKILAKHDEGCKMLLEYREVNKQLTSFVESLPKLRKQDGRIHGQFKQTGTVTGRFSSTNPNLQQQSKPARKMFKAPKGFVIMGADFSAQEPRMLTHFTNEPFLIEVYENNQDLYTMMAAKIFRIPIEKAGKNPDGSDTEYRKQMKMIVLAILYGMSEKALADILGISEMKAKAIILEFFEQFPKVKAWIEGNQEMAKQLGFVPTMFGRKRRLPDARSFDKWQALRAMRQATNARIQGSSAEQTKLVMIAAHALCKKLSNGERTFHILAQIHDELLFLVPEDVTEEEVKLIKDVMVNTVQLRVPSKTDVELGKCWGKMVSEKDWFEGKRYEDKKKEPKPLPEAPEPLKEIKEELETIKDEPKFVDSSSWVDEEFARLQESQRGRQGIFR
ncbi:DNA polymerase [Bacillus thuringiensis]